MSARARKLRWGALATLTTLSVIAISQLGPSGPTWDLWEKYQRAADDLNSAKGELVQVYGEPNENPVMHTLRFKILKPGYSEEVQVVKPRGNAEGYIVKQIHTPEKGVRETFSLDGTHKQIGWGVLSDGAEAGPCEIFKGERDLVPLKNYRTVFMGQSADAFIVAFQTPVWYEVSRLWSKDAEMLLSPPFEETLFYRVADGAPIGYTMRLKGTGRLLETGYYQGLKLNPQLYLSEFEP